MQRVDQKIIIALTASSLVIGCLLTRSIRLSHTTEPIARANDRGVVAVQANDDRPFVKGGKKRPSYLGCYAGESGSTYDVSTDGERPLASLIQRDLARDLRGLGFRITQPENAERILQVSILDWRFESIPTSAKVRFWYELRVRVVASSGQILAHRAFSKQMVVEGNFWKDAFGTLNVMRRELPGIYSSILRQIVKEDRELQEALEVSWKRRRSLRHTLILTPRALIAIVVNNIADPREVL